MRYNRTLNKQEFRYNIHDTISNYVIDYIFWISLILFTNPGGIQQALGVYDIYGSQVNLNDLLFPLMLLCFLFADKKNIYILKSTKKISVALIIFMIYYVAVYTLLIPGYKYIDTNMIFNMIKARLAIYNISLFFFSLVFWKRSWNIFLKIYLASSIIVLSIMFIQMAIPVIKILPLEFVNRGFISIDRQYLISYGIMPFITVIAAIAIVFKFKTNYNVQIILGLILMSIAWILSITRRHILGTIFYFTIALFMNGVISKNMLFKTAPRILRIVFSFLIIIILLLMIFPDYLEAAYFAIEDTIHLLRYGENTAGVQDERLNIFGRYTIIKEFENNPYFGTGYRHYWHTMIGDQAGFEASDYPFQSALAMFGIIGCLFFLPLYLMLINIIYKDLKNNINIRVNRHYTLQYLVLIFILYFIYEIIQYVNWFSPASLAIQTYFYLFLGMYCGARELWYLDLRSNVFLTQKNK